MENLLVYGTLREGGRLRSFYKLETVAKNLILKGYTMFDVSGNRKAYPIAVAKEGEEMVVEFVQAKTPDYMIVRNMEVGSGYKVQRVEHPDYPGEVFNLFVQDVDADILATKTLIKDWIEYVEPEVSKSAEPVRDAQPF